MGVAVADLSDAVDAAAAAAASMSILASSLARFIFFSASRYLCLRSAGVNPAGVLRRAAEAARFGGSLSLVRIEEGFLPASFLEPLLFIWFGTEFSSTDSDVVDRDERVERAESGACLDEAGRVPDVLVFAPLSP